MQWMRVLATASVLLSCVTPARAADTDTHEFFGFWTVASFSGPQVSGCLMSDTPMDGDGKVFLGVSSALQKRLIVAISRPTWSIPDGLTVGVQFVFPGGATYTADGIGSATSISMAMDASAVSTFMRDLAHYERMQVVFRGTERPWTMRVLGADRAIASMTRCVAARGFTSAPMPLGNGADAPARPTAPPATQPY